MKIGIKSDTRVYSVDEITTYIKNLIEKSEMLQNVFVKGEISNFRQSDKKHRYFSLKDENSIIKCAMFYKSNTNLEFKPKEGMEVIIRGHVEVYKKKGNYQIIVEEMQLAGEGELYKKFLQLKEKLEKEGLFKEEIKKLIPRFPKIIGIVTSLEGAVIRDIIKVIKRRWPYLKLIIYPSFVQGDEAKFTLCRGINILNQIKVDVIIIARGGGSFEDLWPFNEEIVARTVYDSEIPIVSAIGHETDFTITDFVADKRAPTPSAAAELITPDKTEILNKLTDLENRLCKTLVSIEESYKQQIDYIMDRPIFKRPFSLIEGHKQFLDEKIVQVKQVVINRIEILKRDLKGFDGKLNALNPYAVLGRGYSITMKKDKVILSIRNINKGDIISTIIKNGKIGSEVKDKNERKII